MNLDATPDTIRAVAEVFKLAAILDDRVAQADRHRIAAWSEQVHRHRLERSDLLDGLQAFYDTPADRPIGVGDLIHHARIVKRARLEKEEDEVREQRRAELDAKAAEGADLSAVTATAISGRIKNRTERLKRAEEALQNCYGKRECSAAIKEYTAAKAEAMGRKPKASKS